MKRRSAVVTVILTVALVGAAFLVRLTEPSDEQSQEPFVSGAVFGQQVEGRDLTFVAEDAYLADRLTSSEWIGETEGVWVVVDATIGAKLGTTLPYVTLRVGDLTYVISSRAGDAALGGSLEAGLPQHGSFVFELPREVVASAEATHAVARFSNGYRVRLDSAIDLVLDLTALRHEKSVALQDPGLVVP